MAYTILNVEQLWKMLIGSAGKVLEIVEKVDRALFAGKAARAVGEDGRREMDAQAKMAATDITAVYQLMNLRILILPVWSSTESRVTIQTGRKIEDGNGRAEKARQVPHRMPIAGGLTTLIEWMVKSVLNAILTKCLSAHTATTAMEKKIVDSSINAAKWHQPAKGPNVKILTTSTD